MLSDINSMWEAAERFQTVSNQQEFKTALYALQNYMKRIGMPGEYFIELERRAYYQQNEYSDKDTKDRMREAAKRVLEYIGQLTYSLQFISLKFCKKTLGADYTQRKFSFPAPSSK